MLKLIIGKKFVTPLPIKCFFIVNTGLKDINDSRQYGNGGEFSKKLKTRTETIAGKNREYFESGFLAFKSAEDYPWKWLYEGYPQLIKIRIPKGATVCYGKFWGMKTIYSDKITIQ